VRKWLQKDLEVVHPRFWNGEQPLHRAVRCGHLGVARLLLDAGSDINTRGEDGQVPALYAIGMLRQGDDSPDLKMLALLLEYKPDLTIADKFGRSAVPARDGVVAIGSTMAARADKRNGAKT
jgi:ankyrin repeat protein